MSQTAKLLEVLSDGGRHTVPELIKYVYGLNRPSSARLAARVYDLRKRGFDIASDALEGHATCWWYQMKVQTRWKKTYDRKPEKRIKQTA